jgi:hypothetical protein
MTKNTLFNYFVRKGHSTSESSKSRVPKNSKNAVIDQWMFENSKIGEDTQEEAVFKKNPRIETGILKNRIAEKTRKI